MRTGSSPFPITITLALLALGCSSDSDPPGDAGPAASEPPPSGSSALDPPVGVWVRSFESTGDEFVGSITPNGDGFRLWGRYQGPATFSPGEPDEQRLATPVDTTEELLVQYGFDGSLGALTPDPLGEARGRLHVSADGSLYVTGSGGFTAGGVTVPEDADVFVAKYAPDGLPLWASSASGEAGMATPTALIETPAGGALIAGTIQGTITFGAGGAHETRLATTAEEIFLARYGSAGELLWAKRAIAGPYLPAWQLAPAGDSGAFLYGVLENRTTFNPDLPDELELLGGTIGFVVKLDDDGNVQWGRAFDQAEGDNRIADLASFDDGSFVVTGSFTRIWTLGLGDPGEVTLHAVGSDFPGRTQFPDLFVARFDADGALLWARREGGEVWDGGAQIEALADGTALLAGSYTNDVTFADGEPAETSLGTESNEMTPFVAMLASDGGLLWVREAPAGQVAVLTDGSLAFANAFMGTVTVFPGEPGEKTLASAGGWDAYVARMEL